MKRALILYTLITTSALTYEPLQGPTELLFCNTNTAFPGYTPFGVGNRTFLLDTRDGSVKVLERLLPMVNSAFRASRYPADHPAFEGRDLTAKGTLTERAAQGIDVYPKHQTPGDRQQGEIDCRERRGKRGGQLGRPRRN